MVAGSAAYRACEDPARPAERGGGPHQVMIAGLLHFAARSNCERIAEGIEKLAELEILREVG